MLKVRDLTISFRGGREAVRGISFDMADGEVLGVVGESGSGKTVTALAIAGLLPRGSTVTSGEIIFDGLDLLRAPREQIRKVQGIDIGMVFQEPLTSMNPTMRVGHQIEETLRIHRSGELSSEQMREFALRMIERVELPDPEQTYLKYPHQLSGGQRQRAMIAAAAIGDPKLLICDEPTTALDAMVQSQILALLRRINEKRGVGILFISHNLSVIRRLCRRVIVMNEGLIVEEGSVEDIYEHPKDDYTKRLIAGARRTGNALPESCDGS